MGDQRADNETALREVKCMNDNGDRKDEQTIKACPMPGCGGECVITKYTQAGYPWGLGFYISCGPCDYRCGLGGVNTEESAVTAHNKLCALVKKGRKYDEAVELLTEINRLGVYMKIMIENGIEEVPPAHKEELLRVVTRTSAFLARIDKEGGE